MDFGEFIVSTRPDAVPEEVLSLLASYRNNMDVWVLNTDFRALMMIRSAT